jgi:nucleotide-binding universal stress UspA family protein
MMGLHFAAGRLFAESGTLLLFHIVVQEAHMIRLKKILFPTDFSETSQEAAHYAISFAREFKAKAYILHVVNQKVFTEGLNMPRVVSVEELEKEMTEEARRRLKTLIPAEEAEGVDMESVIRKGEPFLEIIRFAKEEDVDLIVIGTHGRSGFEHIIFGSTAEKVVRKAPCPVLSVRPEQREFVMP